MIPYAAALNEAQYQAVTCGDGAVLVVAGAGSGKTRTIVYRLAWLVEHGIPPEAILLLTFTRKAAREMLNRAALLLSHGLSGVQGGTFHAFAFSVLRIWRPAWLGQRPFTIMDSGDISDAIRHCKDALGLGKGDRSFPKTQHIVALLSKARNKEQPLEKVLGNEAWHLLPHADNLVALGDAYARYRREKGLMDYDDLLFELEALLRENQAAAASLRLRFRHILVDEYQDTNLVQARLVRLLADPGGVSDAGGHVMAVGDEAQSIYSFRGANVRNILDFPKFFPDTRIIRLEENYRSVRPVLEVANSLLAHAAESFEKRLFTRREGGEAVRLITPLSDISQAKLAVARIRELLARFLPEEIAVLFRAGFHSYHLEMALNHAGIPFRKYGGLRYAEAAHVKDCLCFARLVLNPLDLPAFARLAAMHKGIGPKTVQRLYAAMQQGNAAVTGKALQRHPELLEDLHFIDALRQAPRPPAEMLTAILERYQPRLECLYPDDWPHRRQGLEEITRMAGLYDALDLFMADLALETPEEERDDTGRVVLSTVHSAKGLEWDAVLVIDLVEDRFPSRHAQARPEDFEEERRLMYVACTRARKVLDLYAPASIYNRAERGSHHVGQSPFVREIAPVLTEIWVERFEGHLSRVGDAAARESVAASAPTLPRPEAESVPVATGGFCRHRIFGRGKIVRQLPPDRVQVNFPGFGLKVILAEYLLMED